jgi:hypothetical protein
MHSLGVQLELHEFSLALGRHHSSMREKFGSEVSARESDASYDDGDQEIVKNHVKHPCAIG